MIKYFSVIILLLVLACTATVNNNDALIGFAKEKHDFGIIPIKKEATCTFDFSNTGNTLLIIQDIMTSCGCTVPEWTERPIRPGRKGIVKIKYDAGSPGVFHKTVEVFYNGKGSPAHLVIQGEVQSTEKMD